MQIRILDLVNPGFGIEKVGSGINIPDPQHCIYRHVTTYKLLTSNNSHMRNEMDNNSHINTKHKKAQKNSRTSKLVSTKLSKRNTHI
jgi:hypothetical protein